MNDFFEIYFSQKYLTTILVIVLVLILLVILYLIKCQKKENELEDNYKFKDFDNDKYIKVDEEKSLPLEDEFMFENDRSDDDEDTAIISAEELAKAKANYKKEYGKSVEETISKYEEEQEKKAIISYEELLKSANVLKESFKEPDKSYNLNNITVNQIQGDVKKVNNYIEEELFLRTLKDFRLNLK